MKFICSECNDLREASSFEDNKEGEADPHNGIGAHTHCEVCSNILTLVDCMDLGYIDKRISLNKIDLKKYSGQDGKLYPMGLLKQAQDEERTLLFVQDRLISLRQSE